MKTMTEREEVAFLLYQLASKLEYYEHKSRAVSVTRNLITTVDNLYIRIETLEEEIENLKEAIWETRMGEDL